MLTKRLLLYLTWTNNYLDFRLLIDFFKKGNGFKYLFAIFNMISDFEQVGKKREELILDFFELPYMV